MAGKPAVELAREWFAAAEHGDSHGMAELLSADALFYASELRGRRFQGRDQIELFLSEIGFEATGYTYKAVDDALAVVTLSLRRHLDGNGLADATLAMVFKTEGDEIICIDAFTTEQEALASVRSD
jgi:hypothetical protein